MKLHVIALRKVWYVLSTIMIGASIASFAMWGLKQGIEFTGGSLLAVRFENRPSVQEFEATVKATGVDLGAIVVQPAGDKEMQMRSKALSQEDRTKVFDAIKSKDEKVQELRFDTIGPTIGEELRQKSVRGLIIALILIMAYVAYTFRKVSMPVQSWKYGLVTIFTAFHDIIVPIGVFSVLGHFTGVEIGTPFIAAILTILGYSITDTIVVLDRIRENLQKSSGTFEEIVERSVHQSFLRSFNTSVTTLLTLVAIYLFGGGSLHDFTLTLIIGIATGTYSSIFIASPLLVTWQKWSQKQKA